MTKKKIFVTISQKISSFLLANSKNNLGAQQETEMISMWNKSLSSNPGPHKFGSQTINRFNAEFIFHVAPLFNFRCLSNVWRHIDNDNGIFTEIHRCQHHSNFPEKGKFFGFDITGMDTYNTFVSTVDDDGSPATFL